MRMLEPVRFCLWILLILVASFKGFSQALPEEVPFERVAIPGTIRSSQITNIIQDKLGLIWFTGDGLYRYDGIKIKQYRTIENSERFLEPHEINHLFYDSVGNRLLLATHSLGIIAYDYKTDKLTRVLSSYHVPIINSIAQTGDGKIWVASVASGLFYLDADKLVKAEDPHQLYQRPVTLLAKGKKLFVGELQKLIILENEKVLDTVRLHWQHNELPDYTRITTIHEDKKGNLWIGTEKQGIIVYDQSKRSFIRSLPPSRPPFFSRINALHEDRNGLIWVLTKANGAALYDPVSDKVLRIEKDPTSPTSISSNNCNSILEDRSGIIWLASTGDLNKYDSEQKKFIHIYHNPLDKLSLTDNMVRGVFEDQSKRLWIGTDAGFINIIDEHLRSIEKLHVRLPGDSINYVPLYFTQLNVQTVLICTTHGLLQFEMASKRFSPYQPLWNSTKGHIIRQLLVKNDKLYYIQSNILHVYNTVSKELKSYHRYGDKEARNLTALYFDNQQRMWLGSKKGISIYNEASNDFEYIPFKGLEARSDSSLLLVLTMQQIENSLYVGTFNNGLWKYDLNSHKLMQFKEEDGLPSSTVYGIVPDERNNLWLSTNNGIIKYEPTSKLFIPFNIAEGLQEQEFNRLSALKTLSGKIVFGGVNGVNIFSPDKVFVKDQKYTPKILNISLYDRRSDNYTIKDFADGSTIRLNHDENFASVNFLIDDYHVPKRYKVFYKLNGFENKWKEIINDNQIYFANLSSGRYELELKTVSYTGKESIATVQFIVDVPFWKSWWFLSLSIIVVIASVIFIVDRSVRKAKYDKERLEMLLTERTAEIEKSKEDLHILNQKKDLIFSILSHDLRSPLTTLKGFLGFIIDHSDEMTKEELRKHASNIKHSVTNSLDLIDNTLFWSLSQMGNIHYTPVHFSLPTIIDKLSGLYDLTAEKKNIDLVIGCDEDITLYGDENMVYVTLRNLVANALKFTPSGQKVSLSCKVVGDAAEIIVADNGIGMSSEYIDKLLSLNQPMLKKGTSNEKGTGLGLLLCKRFIELNKGRLFVTSVEGSGTTFTVTLPLGDPALVSAIPQNHFSEK